MTIDFHEFTVERRSLTEVAEYIGALAHDGEEYAEIHVLASGQHGGFDIEVSRVIEV